MNELLAAYAAQQRAQPNPAASQTQQPRAFRDDQGELEAAFQGLNVNVPATKQKSQYSHQNLHDPAKQMRLILLAPAANEQEGINCALQVVNLTDARNTGFTAISYACGDQNNRRDIAVNGLKLSVTYNLYEALANLRHPTKYQRVWADAVCIHQTNLHEKSQQILLMQDIYSLATQVFIWLGQSDRELEILFRQLSSVQSADLAKQTSVFYNMFQYAGESNEILNGFVKLWRKPWFSRVWCVQEYLLASETPVVACGKLRLSWNVINAALVTIDMIWPDKKSPIQRQLQEASTNSLIGAMETTYKLYKKMDLGAALHYTSGRLATDPRDKIYAILGLVSPGIRQSLKPDYTQSLSMVYQQAMVAIIKEHLVLTPLWAAADTKTNPDLNLPSWCLDFSDTTWQKQFFELHEFPLLWTTSCHGACGSTMPSTLAYIEHNLQTSRLTIHGTVIGAIQESSTMNFTPKIRALTQLEKSTTQPGNESALRDLKSDIVYQFLNDIRAATELVYKVISARFGGHAARARIQNGEVWRTFYRGDSTKELLGPIWSKAGLDVPSEYSVFESFLVHQPAGTKPVPSTSWDHDLSPQDRGRISRSQLIHDCIVKSCLAMARAIPDRTFVVTETGYMGRASKDVKSGDLLCVMFRCGRPLIVRPCAGNRPGEQVYNLVGSAWVAGAMAGEVMQRGNAPHYRFTLI